MYEIKGHYYTLYS